MADRLQIQIPAGSVHRPHITDLFKKGWESHVVTAAVKEYVDLLQIENKLTVEDPNKYKALCSRIKSQRIDSYTQFEAELKSKYPNSALLKIIYECYAQRADDNMRKCIADFTLLQDVAASYSLQSVTPTSSKGFSQTVQGHSSENRPYGQAKPFSHTTAPVYEDHRVPSSSRTLDVPETIEFKGQLYVLESMYNKLQQRSRIQEKDIMDFMNQLKNKDKEIEDLRSRLSSFASKQLTGGNPDFTDLGDTNRPSKIGEKFHHIYDEEWTTSLEALTHPQKGHVSLSDEEAITVLMDLIKISYEFCKNYAEKQKQIVMNLWNQSLKNPFASAYSIDQTTSSTQPPTISKSTDQAKTSTQPTTMSKTAIEEFQERRKVFHDECIENAIKNFKEGVISKNAKFKSKMVPVVESYVDKCIEVFWLMSVQNPPMVIRWPEPKSKFEHEHYKEYLKKGTTVKLAVWPAVFLHENGQLMDKGFAMPM